MSPMAKTSMFLLATLGSTTASTPSHTVNHADVHKSSSSVPEGAIHHTQASIAPHQDSAQSAKLIIVEKLAKMPTIGNGLVTATPVAKQASGKSDKVIVEKLAKVPVIGNGLVTATPAMTQHKNATKQAFAKPAASHSEVVATSVKRPLALGKVASAVNSTVNGTPSGDAASVWCGGKYAANCAACPQGNGAMWCHGHCQWTGRQCVSQSQAAVAKDAAITTTSKAVVEPSKTKSPSADPNVVKSIGRATKLSWAHKEGVVAVINHAKTTKTVSHNLQSSKPGVGHFLSAYKDADECSCAFHGVCTCEESMAFMQCISNSCDAGCDCHELQYKDACHNLQSACGDMGLTFDCDAEKATCVAHEHRTTPPPPKIEKTIINARPLPYLNAPKTSDPLTFTYSSLQEMKEDKCQLEAAVREGYVNADDRLEILIPQIEATLGDLESQCLKIPELRCDKDFEEFSGYPVGHRCRPAPPPPAKSGGIRGASNVGLAALLMAAAHATYA